MATLRCVYRVFVIKDLCKNEKSLQNYCSLFIRGPDRMFKQNMWGLNILYTGTMIGWYLKECGLQKAC